MKEVFEAGEHVYLPGENLHGIIGNVERKIAYHIRLADGRTITRWEDYVLRDTSRRLQRRPMRRRTNGL